MRCSIKRESNRFQIKAVSSEMAFVVIRGIAFQCFSVMLMQQLSILKAVFQGNASPMRYRVGSHHPMVPGCLANY